MAGGVVALFISKPILWNTQRYLRPSGVVANSGFPSEHGFGHEEWNNAPALAFSEGGVKYRAFHTEGVGNAPVADEAGRTFVFMYASHDGVQELVGIAGNATCLIGDLEQRQQLVNQLDLNRLADDAWSMQRVQLLHHNDRDDFNGVWSRDLNWIPNWRCPAETYLWLDEPTPLDAMALRSTSKLLTMFSQYTKLTRAEALRWMDAVPNRQRSLTWRRIRAEIEGPDFGTIIEEVLKIRARQSIQNTTCQQLIDARLGQANFRRDLEQHWGGACAVSGCTVPAVLRASHIKPWSRSTDTERLDGSNGLLLTADLDALFDRGLISFNDDGTMLLSGQLSAADCKVLGLPRPLRRQPSNEQRRYLLDHRCHWGYRDGP